MRSSVSLNITFLVYEHYPQIPLIRKLGWIDKLYIPTEYISVLLWMLTYQYAILLSTLKARLYSIA